jgi:hypothetical protein
LLELEFFLNFKFSFVDFIYFLFFLVFLFFDSQFHFIELKFFEKGISQENFVDNSLVLLFKVFTFFIDITHDFSVFLLVFESHNFFPQIYQGFLDFPDLMFSRIIVSL